MSLAAALRAWDELHSAPASDAGSLSPSPSTSTLDSAPEPVRQRQRAQRKAHDIAYGKFQLPDAGSSKSSLRACIGLPPVCKLRKHEHLAVLIDRSLWKSDKEARQCDVWNCDTVFSLFERRHHCRKCGGVFCAAHSSRTTSLLDTSRLDIFHPPRGQPITDFASPASPVVLDARVCDGCHDLLHGIPSWPSAASSPVSASPQQSLASLPPLPTSSTPTSSVRMLARRTHSPHSRSSASASPLAATPPDGECALPPPGLLRAGGVRRHSTAPLPPPAPRSIDGLDGRPSRSGSLAYFPVPQSEPAKPAPADMLTAYPLHEHSSQCKRRASDRRRLQQRLPGF